MKPIPFTATVLSNEYIAEETRKTVFRIDTNFAEKFAFSTGQFVNLKCPKQEQDTFPQMRAYSVASSSTTLPNFELCVKVVENGLGSGYIDTMQAGESVNFMGPFGHFGRKSEEKNILMVATGTGIAPMKAIIEEQVEKKFPQETTLVFGVREEKFASYKSYFQTLAETHENFSFYLYISRPEEDSTSGYEGRVTNFFKEISSEDLENTEVLICGNPAMVKQVQNFLVEEKGLEKKDIITEAY